ncbi:hypothetical protein BpHYR1_025790 [Brachionus plicatilis]|uniref:Uncharacterized protein n=1 Tax=Brachionus plicatilis TaxID=10195 RepID=A0A3M7Q238_BRAPC|nr:hypothetical protein BpHYR1_025790 [Brachionus plicatilis]
MSLYEEKYQDFTRSVKYFKKNRDPYQLMEDVNAFESLLAIKNLIQDDSFLEKNTDWSCLLKYEFDKILTTLFSSYSQICNSFKLKNYEYNEKLSNLDSKPNDRTISMLVFIIQITYNLTQMPSLSTQLHLFNQQLIDNHIIDILLEFFEKDVFLNEYNKSLDIHHLMISILKIFKNFSEHKFLSKKIWTELDMERLLVEFSKKCRLESQFNKELNFVHSNLREEFSAKKLLDLLNNCTEPGRIMKNYDIYCMFLKLYKMTQTKSFQDYESLLNVELFAHFEKMLFYASENRLKFDFEDQAIELDYPKNSLSCNETRVSMLHYLTSLINSIYYFKSKRKDYLTVTDNKIFFIYMNMLGDKEFVERIIQCPVDICFNIIEFVYLVSRNSHNEKTIWSELHAYETLQRLAKILLKKTEKMDNRVFLCYWVMCFVREETWPDTDKTVRTTMDTLFQQLDPENKNQNCLFGLKIAKKNLLNCLRRLALNPEFKRAIYKKLNIIKHFIYDGDDKEKFYALRLLIQLCFDANLVEGVLEDRDFCDFLRSFYEIELSKNSKLFHSAESVLWLLNLIPDADDASFEPGYRTVVMISFDKCDENLCQKLRKKLENSDLYVITSQNSQRCFGVQNCHLCLALVNEKYRLNEYCQIEARYAKHLGKELVRVNTQENFEEIDGWIASVFSQHISFNLYTNDLDKLVKALLSHVKSLNLSDEKRPRSKDSKETDKIKSVSRRSSDVVPTYAWSSDQVAEWFQKKNINKSMVENLGKIDGKILAEIYKIKCESVDFFYQRLLAENGDKIKLSDIALLKSCLDELFEGSD